MHIFIADDKFQRGCTKEHALQQLRKGWFPHTFASTGQSFLEFQKRQLRLLIFEPQPHQGMEEEWS